MPKKTKPGDDDVTQAMFAELRRKAARVKEPLDSGAVITEQPPDDNESAAPSNRRLRSGGNGFYLL